MMKTLHPVLAEMASTLGEYHYERLVELYSRHHKKRSDIERDVSQWLRDGYVEGQAVKPFYTNRVVYVSPARWPELLKMVDTPVAGKSLTYSFNSFYVKAEEKLFEFIHDFHSFLHTNVLPPNLCFNDLDRVSNYFPTAITAISRVVLNPEYVEFSKAIHPDVLEYVFYNAVVVRWQTKMEVSDVDVLRQVYFENPSLSERDCDEYKGWYIRSVELLRSGNILELLNKVSENDLLTHEILYAYYYLFCGKPELTYKFFSGMLKSTKSLFYDCALTNFFYALSIGMTNSPQSRKAAEKLLKIKDLDTYHPTYPMRLVLHHFFRGDAADYASRFMPTDCSDLQGRLLAVLFIKHYKINVKAMPEIWAETFVLNSDFNLLKLLFCDDFDSLKPLAQDLRMRTGLDRPLMPEVKKMSQWEIVIDQVLKNVAVTFKPSKKSAAQEEMSRVVYLLDMDSLNVQPKLQKSKDGGVTWSKGRNIAMSRFATCSEPAMSPNDIKVANLAEQDSWYGGNDYYLCGARVVAELVGSQVVFDEKTDQRIDIREEPLQLLVQPSPSGFSVRTNVNVSKLSDGIFLKREGDKQITVVRVSDSQLTTLRLLQKVRLFPKESEQQLTSLLETLSAQFMVMSPLLKNAKELKTVPSSPLIIVQMSPAEAHEFQVTLAVKPFGSHPPYQKVGQGMSVVSTTIDGEQVQTERDLIREQANLSKLTELMEPFDNALVDDDTWMLDTAQALQLLEIIRLHPDICCVEWPKGARMRVVKPMLTPDRIRLKISSAGQWFELEGDVQIDEKHKMKMAELLSLVATSEGNFIRLSGDEYVALSEQLRKQLQALDKLLAGRGKQLKVAQVNGMQLSLLKELGVQVEADRKFKSLLNRIGEADRKEFKLPSNIHAELRNYQMVGYQWMSKLAWWGAGACLADDMGLGKTLQSICLMQSRAELGPQLVIVPTSLLHNWQQELKRFAPALSVHNLNQPGANRHDIVSKAQVSDIVISTYGLLVTEGELLTSRTWTTVVLDEAHTIKNQQTQTSKGAMELKADFRLLLTGTPLQNHLSEIWNLFQFANPGLLGSFKQFADRFIIPVERDHDKDRQRLLKRILSPFLLRRTKDDVLEELPEKTEITMRVELSPEEQALYDNLRQKAIVKIEGARNSAIQTLAEITRLRQAACHPRLVNDSLNIQSSKTAAFLELADTLLSNGHRVLVFSQFTSHLSLVREELDKKQIPYLYLDGSHTATQRNRLVQQFQTGDMPLFLISLKAGGLGLNLTAADYVIHLDPWWNPSVEDQASDRAHRIGQERPVTVYRLIAANTIEEKIIRLHQNKRSLADALLQEADMFAQISAEEVVKLLRESVDAIG